MIDARGRLLSCIVAALFSGVIPAAAGTVIVNSAAAITAAAATAAPGDTLLLTAGTWTDQRIVFRASGTAQLPIVLRAASYGSVTLTGSSTLRISGTYLIVENLAFQGGASTSGDVIEFRTSSSLLAAHCRLTHSSVINYNPASSATDYKWASLYGSNNRVDYCWFEGKNHSGTTLVVWLAAQPNYHQIDHNYFGPRPDLGVNGGETIRVGTSDWSMYDSFTITEQNLFDRCNGEIEIISNKSCGNVYRYNVFLECKGTLTLRHGNRCSVYGNYFVAHRLSSTGGVRIIGEDHRVFNNYIEGTTGDDLRSGISLMNGIPNSPLNGYYRVQRATVAFNTLVNNSTSITVGAGKDTSKTLPPLDCVIANNVVLSPFAPLITLNDTPQNMTWEGNVVFGATVGLALPPSNRIANPLLTTNPDAPWRLTEPSPARDSAAGIYAFVTDDIDGQPRVSPFDAGADEYSAESVTRTPVSRDQVGPQTQPTSIPPAGGNTVPGELRLYGNFPNPFNPGTTFRFSVPATGRATLRVFALTGQEVGTVFDGIAAVSVVYTREFVAHRLATGVYIARLEHGGHSVSRKILLIR